MSRCACDKNLPDYMCEKHWNRFQALESRNAKLVEALEKIVSDHPIRESEKLHLNYEIAIAALKENG